MSEGRDAALSAAELLIDGRINQEQLQRLLVGIGTAADLRRVVVELACRLRGSSVHVAEAATSE